MTQQFWREIFIKFRNASAMFNVRRAPKKLISDFFIKLLSTLSELEWRTISLLCNALSRRLTLTQMKCILPIRDIHGRFLTLVWVELACIDAVPWILVWVANPGFGLTR